MHQLLNYQGGTIPSDSANTASAIMERDANGQCFASGINAGAEPAAAPTGSAYLSTTGAMLIGGQTYTTTATLTAASPHIAKCNATSAAFTITLPVASSSANLFYRIYKSDSSANAVTVKGNGTDNIQVGATGANTTSLATQGAVVRLWCDGTGWVAL